MRTQEQIARIKSRIIDPYIVNNFISYEDVRYLISLFESQKADPVKVYKNTGPVTLDIQSFLEDTVVKKMLAKIEDEIGSYTITAGFFFWTNYPHVIHNDDTYELPDGVYRAITIPLKLDSLSITEYPRLCFFNQFYFHGPSKFFKGETKVPTYYNQCVYDYANIDGLVDTLLEDKEKLFTHLKPQWLEGLSLHSTLPWKPTSAIVFDSIRLHCASDFRQLNIPSKLGISIFTKVE